MPIAVTGSIATDHLMHFPGKFAEQLLPDQLHRVSLSFLVDDLVVRRGGVARQHLLRAWPSSGCGRCWSARPARTSPTTAWLERHGVDCASVLRLRRRADRPVRLHHRRRHEPDRLVLRRARWPRPGRSSSSRSPRASAASTWWSIGADDPEAMVRHSEECRERGYPFAADPSQQLARMDGDDVATLVDGATCLFTNDYE